MIYETFCGGIFETNCYLVKAPEGWILFDAPDGACDWLVSRNVTPKLLLLTHGHFDHIPDVAKIKHRFGCQIGCHPLTAPMISDPEFFRSFGFQLEIEPVEPDFFIEETARREVSRLGNASPGCSGTLSRQPLLFFAPGPITSWRRCPFRRKRWPRRLARWRCRSFDRRDQAKLFPLGDNVTVLPGHGPPTKIGTERMTNPFVR